MSSDMSTLKMLCILVRIIVLYRKKKGGNSVHDKVWQKGRNLMYTCNIRMQV